MLRRKNKNLRIVEGQNEFTDQSVGEIEKQVRQRKTGVRRRIVIGAVAAAAVLITAFLVIYLQTYTSARVSDTYKVSGAADSSYEEFAGGILKYSRDGISLLDKNGEERWNQPCQIKNPFADVNDVSAAVADKGGNTIMVFQEEGLKGEIETTLPIEKISVSEQGIVSAILKNESSPAIVCYDAAGNILVEQRASLTGTGYPLDVAISADGEVMQVVYLYVQEGEITSKVGYYNFGEAGEEAVDHEVTHKEYGNSVLASGFFLNQSVSAVVGDNCITLFKGKKTPEEVTTVTLKKEIQSVFHNDKYIGLILKNEGKEGYELCLYNASGKKVMSEDFKGSYKNVKISGSQIILYDGRKLSIFLRSGMKRFEGEMDNNILEIFPVMGVNKYIVMNANGMENVRLVK